MKIRFNQTVYMPQEDLIWLFMENATYDMCFYVAEAFIDTGYATRIMMPDRYYNYMGYSQLMKPTVMQLLGQSEAVA